MTGPQTPKEAIRANVIMLSGSKDEQTSADVFDISSFDLPSDAGPGGAGGACTNSLLSIMYNTKGSDVTWIQLLKKMHDMMKQKKFEQVPQLSSSRVKDLNNKVQLIHPGGSGRTRAVLIGINYVGTNAELRGCWNDVEAMNNWLVKQGFKEGPESLKILQDDGFHLSPTSANIMAAFKWLGDGARAGDSLFVHYSGHGGQMKDDDGDEEDGLDETIIPVDYKQAGQIRDDKILKNLVCPLPEDVCLTVVMDCCHSGTVLDLPYMFKATDATVGINAPPPTMVANPSFSMERLKSVATGAFAAYQKGGVAAAGKYLSSKVTDDDKKELRECSRKCTDSCTIA
mmetsp:Transcript_5934/g.10274  ORF Transcript_5934/g.10274 Transcript_5934/m.10274 type:complete len:342 (-) Transcript_5934:249-1274(-)